MKKKVVSKGYTLEIVSWENDGDNYKTNYHTVETLEEAYKLHKICIELFCSCNNGEKGLGNSMDGEGIENIIDFVKNNKELFTDLEVDVEKIDIDNSYENDVIIEELYDYFYKISWPLIGGSEDYDFRVCKSCIVTYSSEDIYLDIIEFV